MRKSATIAAITLAIGVLAGGTILASPVAQAAQAILNVQVMNSADNPVPVHEQGTVAVLDAGTPLEVQLYSFADPTFFVVPDGKRFVVQYINGQILLNSPTSTVHIDILHSLTSSADSLHYQFLGERQETVNGINEYVSEQVVIDAGPGDHLLLNVPPSLVTGVILSGYLVDD